MPMDECCCFSLRTGCFSAGIFCAVENFCYCVGIAVRYQITEDEIPDEIEHKVMSAFLIYLIVLSGTMFLFNIFFIIGTLFDWKHVIFGWVVVYSMLLGMRSVMFLATAVLCIMIPTCNSILGVIIFSAAYIPMAFHSFFVMVVHGYFRYLQPRETPVFIVSKRGGSFQKESPRRIVSRPKVASIVSPKEATNKPNPRQATNQPNPKEPSNKPNPEEATNKSNPKEATNKPNPKELPNRSNPKQPPNRTNPKEPSYRPIPEEWASHLLCYCKRELRNK